MPAVTLGFSILVSGAFGTVEGKTPLSAPHQVVASAHHAPVAHAAAHAKRNASAQFAQAVLASPPDPEVRAAVNKYFADIPIMIAIAQCESKFHQYDLTGDVLTSATDDLGVMQINATRHRAEAVALGYDLSDLEDNMAFARYLYNEQGTDPWLSSSQCWYGAGNTASTVTGSQSLAVQK